MIWSRFETTVPGKWVLAGEHSVLRGATAVALPHPELSLSLRFEPSMGHRLVVVPESAQPIVMAILDSLRALPSLSGTLWIESTIPVGAGLGSSAALCVALTQWLAEPLGIPRGDWIPFATRLEDRFHGESSGMDVAVIAAGKPVAFTRGQPVKPLEITRLPRFTSDCVAQVEVFRASHIGEAAQLDEQMAAASLEAIQGLQLYNTGRSPTALEHIARAMLKAQDCFFGWRLVPDEAIKLQRSLRDQGALASKLTGAGGGGMVVALWE
jgi:mevalonate kinase